MAKEIHVGDWGTELLADVFDEEGPLDLDDFTSYVFEFRPPRGANKFQIVPEILGAPVNGQLIYVVPLVFSGGLFFYTDGTWRWQAIVGAPIGGWSSNIFEFRVHKNV